MIIQCLTAHDKCSGKYVNEVFGYHEDCLCRCHKENKKAGVVGNPHRARTPIRQPIPEMIENQDYIRTIRFKFNFQ